MDEKRRKFSREYLKARKKFRDYADQDSVLQGNDNIIGRIGEAIAHSFLEQQGRIPEVILNQTEPGYDIICHDNGDKVSVKLITFENERGSTSKIKKPFDIFIGIELSNDFNVLRLAYITRKQFEFGLLKMSRVPEPNFSRNMFNINNLFPRFGKVFCQDELKDMKLL
ncbi:hypothetical protein [Autumnicola musiva]|uniref:Uncharacterized protein n=1 Tax=Autumnicola musiva TaxID=3075589 RepID=A0ABU3D4K2_9FLAO|nr:hypothetical protein [Zunongwangia sp. F117]MDT0676462.1 hypothetical protein [Zunongwangia sp. F117]